jgi:hypothetical protein
MPDWPGIALLRRARDYPGRHGAILLAWDAALAALAEPPRQAKPVPTRGAFGGRHEHHHAGADRGSIRLVIAASSAGTVFEWYDFFIYGTLGSILSKAFFPTGNATLELLLFWLVFAVGFGFRPLGAVLFGFLGDRLGRKYTFLATVG